MVHGGFAEWRCLTVSFRFLVELQGHRVCLDFGLGLPIFHGVQLGIGRRSHAFASVSAHPTLLEGFGWQVRCRQSVHGNALTSVAAGGTFA
jgi:hypothetical protein